MNNVLNQGEVMTSDSFKVSLYAISGGQSYPIARQTAGITVDASELQAGTINSFSLTAVDSKVI